MEKSNALQSKSDFVNKSRGKTRAIANDRAEVELEGPSGGTRFAVAVKVGGIKASIGD